MTPLLTFIAGVALASIISTILHRKKIQQAHACWSARWNEERLKHDRAVFDRWHAMRALETARNSKAAA